MLSDHVPVYCRIGGANRKHDVSSIPRWITHHSYYQDTFELLIRDQPIDDCPFVRLNDIKFGINEAAKVIRKNTARKGPANDKQKVFWARKAWRCWRTHNTFGVLKCIGHFSEASEMFDHRGELH